MRKFEEIKWTPERDAELMMLREHGLTFAAIAQRWHTSRSAIAGRVRRLTVKQQKAA